jgi:hypothetical protein
MAEIATNRTRVSHHRNRLQSEARKGAQVSDKHLVIGMPRTGLIEIEGIGILHQELAAAHQTEPRPHLVAEFPLDVVKIKGQVLIRSHVGAENFGDHLLVGRTE